MARSGVKMPQAYKDILTKVRDPLVSDLEPQMVLVKMAASFVFNAKDEEDIKGEKTRWAKSEMLLERLNTKSSDAYDYFKEALREVQPHLENLIVRAETNSLAFQRAKAGLGSRTGVQEAVVQFERFQISSEATDRSVNREATQQPSEQIDETFQATTQPASGFQDVQSSYSFSSRPDNVIIREQSDQTSQVATQPASGFQDAQSSYSSSSRPDNVTIRENEDSTSQARAQPARETRVRELAFQTATAQPSSGARGQPLRYNSGNSRLCDRQVEKICKEVASCWQDLGRKLGLLSAPLKIIDKGFNLAHEKARGMLQEWRRKEDENATLRALYDALNDLGRQDIVTNIKKKLVIKSATCRARAHPARN
ncbi:uncharacterized protein LOC111346864 isoform X1 [Stylophora pistillata]|nr:uncharacterized protein LOC111346864 isoform X1 [Stylophora pistillata]